MTPGWTTGSMAARIGTVGSMWAPATGIVSLVPDRSVEGVGLGAGAISQGQSDDFATTEGVLPGFEQHLRMEAPAIFLQHAIACETAAAGGFGQAFAALARSGMTAMSRDRARNSRIRRDTGARIE